MKLAIALLSLVLALPAFAQTADQPKADPNPVVARVNGTELRLEALEAERANLPARLQELPLSTLYPQLLEQAVIGAVVQQQAANAKLDNDPEVQARLEQARRDIVAQLFLKRQIEPKLTDALLQDRYKDMVKEMPKQDEVRARHILVEKKEEAEALLKQVQDGDDMAALATTKSKDTGSRERGGDLGFFSQREVAKPFADAAFAAKKGELVAAPVQTQFGWHVIRVEDRRPVQPPSFDSVKAQLRQQVGQELVADYLRNQVEKAKVERFNLDGSPLAAPKE